MTDLSSGLNELQNIEAYRQTFQKTSQIYKYLRNTWRKQPLYLIRTLSYVIQNRPKRNITRNPARKSVSLNVICDRLKQAALARKAKQKQNLTNSTTSNNNNVSELNRSNNVNGTNGNGIKKVTPTLLRSGKNATHRLPNNELATSDGYVICYYRWVCNNPEKTSQKTMTIGFCCAWCNRNFWARDSLMMHLKTSHQRCNFNIVEEPVTGHKVIEMTHNPSFDGSYCGFKYPGHNITRDFSFRPQFPTPRDSFTQIIFFRTRVKKITADTKLHKINSNPENIDIESDEFEPDVDISYGRLYYHTSTCLPIKPNENDIDSEADMDPEWLRERTQLMIDEFADVNEGEKEILKLWNLHIMKNYKYKADSHIRQACFDFIEVEGPTILSKNLSKNFTLHLANLFDFGLISSGDLLECIREFRKLKLAHRETRAITSSPTKSNGTKRTSNEHCQHSPPAKRALYNN